MTLDVKSQAFDFYEPNISICTSYEPKTLASFFLGLVWISIEGEFLFVGEANQQKVGLKMKGTEMAYPSIRQTN